MYDIDVYGSKAILNLIEQSKHIKFTINKAGAAKGGASVFQCNYTASNEQAKEEFKRWADNMNGSNNAYELYLFTNAEESQKKATANPKTPIKFLFCLQDAGGRKVSGDTDQRRNSGTVDAESITTLITLSIEKALATREESETAKRLRLIEERLEEEEEEEELNGTPPQSELMQLLSVITASGGLMGTTKQPTAVNGTVEDGKAKLARINTAIQRLHKVNPDIDSDLLKLADIAEQKPEMFKMLTNSLRAM